MSWLWGTLKSQYQNSEVLFYFELSYRMFDTGIMFIAVYSLMQSYPLLFLMFINLPEGFAYMSEKLFHVMPYPFIWLPLHLHCNSLWILRKDISVWSHKGCQSQRQQGWSSTVGRNVILDTVYLTRTIYYFETKQNDCFLMIHKEPRVTHLRG